MTTAPWLPRVNAIHRIASPLRIVLLRNTPFQELSQPQRNRQRKPFNFKPFTKDALTGKQVNEESLSRNPDNQNSENSQQEQQYSEGNNQRYEQKKFSVEEVGTLSLSTYAWEWAPYINKLKRKHQGVWFAPPAYSRLEIIHGKTREYLRRFAQ